MPLYKRKPLALVEKPSDLKNQELVFQIRFTKEIFRNYSEYLRRINLYHQRVWNCKATGKGNLTYEEALISEKKASERIRNVPSEYVALVLRDVQYSMLNLKDLVNSIAVKLQGPFAVGAELFGRKDGRLRPCKILKILHEDASRTQYEIAWLSSDHEVIGKIIVNADELTGKNPPLSKRFLKSFIKDSTYRSLPWVIHDSLAKDHGISTAPPLELKSQISIQDGLVVCNRKRKKIEDKQKTAEQNENGLKVYKRRKSGEETSNSTRTADAATENPEAKTIKYPIDDLLVEPAKEDLLTERPCPYRDFNIPMDCVGNLLMVWDFCSSYGRLFNLSPFSLEDFENSVCYKDSTPLLIVEFYSTLLRLLLNETGKFSMAVENKKRKSKITQVNWTEYLCDFLETSCTVDFSMHISTIKRGHYALLDIHVKLAFFQELIAQALETDTIRDKLDEYVEERQALSATRRDEALDEGRKRREEKERRNSEAAPKKEVKLNEDNYAIHNGVFTEKRDDKVYTRKKNHSSVNSQQNHSSRNRSDSETEHGDSISGKNSKKQNVEPNSVENGNHLSKREIHKLKKNEIKESIEMKSIEQRKEFLEREIEKRFIRTIPLGKDRNYCRYWFFRRDGRVFVENSDSKQWGYYKTKEELDALIGSLNPKGERERALKKQLEKFYNKICAQLHKRWKEAQRDVLEDDTLVRRSTRVRAPPRDNPALAFLKYENKWKEI